MAASDEPQRRTEKPLLAGIHICAGADLADPLT